MKKCIFTALLLIMVINLRGSTVPSEKELLEKLKENDYWECGEIVEWCGLLKVKKAVPLLVQLLENKGAVERHWGSGIDIITALGKIGDPGAIDILLRCLPNGHAISALEKIDPNWRYRQEARNYFAQQLDEFYKNLNGGDVGETFENLLAINSDEQRVKNLCLEILPKKKLDFYIIEMAIDRLVKAGAIGAVGPLLDRLENFADDDEIDACVKALDSLLPAWRESRLGKAIEEKIIGEFKKIKAKIPRPIDVEDTSTPRKYRDKIKALIRYPSGVSLLLEVLRDEQEFVFFRREAAWALGNIARPGDNHIICALIALLQHENPELSSTALEGLNRIGRRYKGTAPAEPGAPEIVHRLVILMENPDIEAFRDDDLIDGLLIWGDEQVAPILLNRLKNKPDEYPYRTFPILARLVELNHPETFAAAVRLYNAAGEDRNGKELYLKILGELKDPKALPLLQKALTDKDRSVRAYAEWAIYHITKE